MTEGRRQEVISRAGEALLHPRSAAEAARTAVPAAAPAQRLNPACEVALSVFDDLTRFEAEWRRFEAIADCTAFQSYDWLATWQAHVGAATATTPAIVLGRRPGGDILFILPLAVRRRGLLADYLLGHDLCDYNAPLLAPGAAEAMGEDFPRLWRDIGAALRRDPPPPPRPGRARQSAGAGR